MASNGMLARYKKRKAPPKGWEEVEQVMQALDDEMKKGGQQAFSVGALYVLHPPRTPPQPSPAHMRGSARLRACGLCTRSTGNVRKCAEGSVPSPARTTCEPATRRYIFDMFYEYKRIPRKVLDYCVAEVRVLERKRNASIR